jgi:hypothetical protein
MYRPWLLLAGVGAIAGMIAQTRRNGSSHRS